MVIIGEKYSKSGNFAFSVQSRICHMHQECKKVVNNDITIYGYSVDHALRWYFNAISTKCEVGAITFLLDTDVDAESWMDNNR